MINTTKYIALKTLLIIFYDNTSKQIVILRITRLSVHLRSRVLLYMIEQHVKQYSESVNEYWLNDYYHD